MHFRKVFTFLAMVCGAAMLPAQDLSQYTDFKVLGHDVQIHGFASTGFAYSTSNNYLTMDTSTGDSFSDYGINMSSQINDKFRVGAQMDGRSIGRLGHWQPQLDWAVADYRFKEWFGIRGGKVKSMLGLYNDTQDMEFLHTWAILPQSTYPLDLRGDTIAHEGGELYGHVELKKAGSVNYSVYGGTRPDDAEGGYRYAFLTFNMPIVSYGGPVYGADLRWTTPVRGLLAGISYMNQNITIEGVRLPANTPYTSYTYKNYQPVYYYEYNIGNLRLDGEYRRNIKKSGTAAASATERDLRAGFVSAAYRLNKRLEVGAYHSRYIYDWRTMHSLPTNHLFDTTITARVDVTRSIDFKIEEHFIDGDVSSLAFRGFYGSVNPQGFKPAMDMLVLRLGFHM